MSYSIEHRADAFARGADIMYAFLVHENITGGHEVHPYKENAFIDCNANPFTPSRSLEHYAKPFPRDFMSTKENAFIDRNANPFTPSLSLEHYAKPFPRRGGLHVHQRKCIYRS